MAAINIVGYAHRTTEEWIPNMRALAWACSFWLLATFPAWAQNLACDADFVALSGAEILVAPTGDNDTANLQCALDEAVGLGVQKIKLEPGNYFIGSVAADRFEGQLEGRSTATTVVNAVDRSLTCSDDALDSLLRFNLGAPTVKFMTIKASLPCAANSGGGFVAVYFSNNPANCNQRTFFGTVDRVAFEAATQQRLQAIAVAGTADFSCPGTLPANGTLKVNRSAFDNFFAGIVSTMGAGSQVDVNFNEFSRNDLAVNIIDANQSTTITQNTFNYSDVVAAFDTGGAIQIVTASAESPSSNRTVVHKNTFNDGGANAAQAAIVLANAAKRADHSVVISQNTFNLAGIDNSSAIEVLDIDAGSIQGNIFKGNALGAISIYREFFAASVVDWSIVANNFAGLNTFVDIFFSNGTSDNVIGAQNARIDAPAGNDIISGNQILAVSDAVALGEADAREKALAAAMDSKRARLRDMLAPKRVLYRQP